MHQPTEVITKIFAPIAIYFQQQMMQEIKLNYFNEELKTGFFSWGEASLLFPVIRQLDLETYKGGIIYSLEGFKKKDKL